MLGEDHFGLRRGRGTGDAIGMLRIISEKALDIDEELRACLANWQKAFDRVNWTKFMQILKITGICWCGRRLIRKLYVDQSAELNWTRVRQEVRRLEEKLQNVAVCRRVYSSCSAHTVPGEFLKTLETSKWQNK